MGGTDEDDALDSRAAEGSRRGVSADGYEGMPLSSSLSFTIASGKSTLLLGGDGSGVGGSCDWSMTSGAGDVGGSFCTLGRGAGGGTDAMGWSSIVSRVLDPTASALGPRAEKDCVCGI